VESAADGSLLQKIELAQVHEGAEHIRIFNWSFPILSQPPKFYIDNILAGVATYRAAAGLEPSLASRVRLYEVPLITLKRAEQYIEYLVQNGVITMSNLNIIRFHRLGAEAELLTLNESLVPTVSPAPIIVCPPPIPRCRPRLFQRRSR
jgi:hypothetical protein